MSYINTIWGFLSIIFGGAFLIIFGYMGFKIRLGKISIGKSNSISKKYLALILKQFKNNITEIQRIKHKDILQAQIRIIHTKLANLSAFLLTLFLNSLKEKMQGNIVKSDDYTSFENVLRIANFSIKDEIVEICKKNHLLNQRNWVEFKQEKTDLLFNKFSDIFNTKSIFISGKTLNEILKEFKQNFYEEIFELFDSFKTILIEKEEKIRKNEKALDEFLNDLVEE